MHVRYRAQSPIIAGMLAASLKFFLVLFGSFSFKKKNQGSTDSIGMCGLVADFSSDEGEKLQEYFVYFKIF